MDVFSLRDSIVGEYRKFATSFTTIHAEDIRAQVEAIYSEGRFWPDPLLQINPSYKRGLNLETLIANGALDPQTADIFRADGAPLSLYKHQEQAVVLASQGESYVVTTGTGSGKSLCFFIPIVSAVLAEKRESAARRTRAIIIYPMNALANSQLGCVLPAGIATDDTTKSFFQQIVERPTLLALYHFENEEWFFVGVNNMFRFVVLATGESARNAAPAIVAFARSASAPADPSRRYSLSADKIALFNPNTRTFPIFFRRRDADINLAMYGRAGVLWPDSKEDGGPWRVSFVRMFDMTNDAGLFRTRPELESSSWLREQGTYRLDGNTQVPLVEAKKLHHFDERYATYRGATQASLNKGTLPTATNAQHSDPDFRSEPLYWVAETEIAQRLDGRWSRRWFLGWRDITNAHNERTVVACVFHFAGVEDTTPLLLAQSDARAPAFLYGCLCCFALDYAAQQKVGGTHLNCLQFRQLPVPPPSHYEQNAAWDLEPFAHDVGYYGPPFQWDPERRFLLRCELDAAFFHLYGPSRSDTDCVMDTFPIVRKNHEKAHGDYRTKRVILEFYEAMTEAARTGKPYQTRLDPPPADPRVAHPESTRPAAEKRGAR